MSPARASAASALDGSARVFGALGDGTRLRLVARLCAAGPMSIARLTAGSAVTRQAVTKHLHVLADAGLVSGRRRGRETVFDVERARLEEAREFLGMISAWWDDALGRLKASLEAERG